jgi:hypothetical protein
MQLDDLYQFIRLLRLESTLTTEMDFHKLALLVVVAKEPGLTIEHYAERAEMHFLVAARFFREMRVGPSKRKWPRVGTLGLIEAGDEAGDWKKRGIVLTQRGKLLIEQLLTLGNNPSVKMSPIKADIESASKVICSSLKGEI